MDKIKQHLKFRRTICAAYKNFRKAVNVKIFTQRANFLIHTLKYSCHRGLYSMRYGPQSTYEQRNMKQVKFGLSTAATCMHDAQLPEAKELVAHFMLESTWRKSFQDRMIHTSKSMRLCQKQMKAQVKYNGFRFD